MTSHSDQPFPADTDQAVIAEIKRGTRILGVAPDDDPEKIVAAVDAFVYGWQCGDRPPETVLDAGDAPFTLGAVWGEQFVRRFGWGWRMITFHEQGDSVAPGVLSPDRALAAYPIHFVMGCLQDHTVDATILIAFKMLESGKIASTTPGSYFDLMDGVHRIVPRIATPRV